jgi:hypothetical protein
MSEHDSEAVAGPELAATAPCPDPAQNENLNVAGIELGMSVNDAIERIRCAAPSLQVSVQEYSSNRPGGDRFVIAQDASSRNLGEEFRLEQEGLPGQEKVYSIARHLRFTPGSEPLVANVVEELNRKYHLIMEQERHFPRRWFGRRYEATGLERRGNSSTCFPTHYGGVGATGNPDERCGLAIFASIEPQSGNEALAEKVTVFIADVRVFVRESARRTEHFEREAQARQAQEIESARERRVPAL